MTESAQTVDALRQQTACSLAPVAQRVNQQGEGRNDAPDRKVSAQAPELLKVQPP